MYIFEAHYTNMDNNEEITRKLNLTVSSWRTTKNVICMR